MGVEARGEFVSEKRDPVRLVDLRGLEDETRILRHRANQIPLARVGQERHVGFRKRPRIEVEVRKGRLALSQNAADSGVGVLNVKDRVVLALLDHFREVEVDRSVVPAHQHDEADGVRADFVHDFPEGHEVSGSLRHFDRLALAHEADELTQAHLELRLVVR